MIEDPPSRIFINKRVVVRVKVNRPKTKIVEATPEIIQVDIAAPPENNKANIELLKFFSRITKKACRIVSGRTTKEKIIEFT